MSKICNTCKHYTNGMCDMSSVDGYGYEREIRCIHHKNLVDYYTPYKENDTRKLKEENIQLRREIKELKDSLQTITRGLYKVKGFLHDATR